MNTLHEYMEYFEFATMRLDSAFRYQNFYYILFPFVSIEHETSPTLLEKCALNFIFELKHNKLIESWRHLQKDIGIVTHKLFLVTQVGF